MRVVCYAIVLLVVDRVCAFQLKPVASRINTIQLADAGNDDPFDGSMLLPETNFGSEAVPEGQRPINEYLDVIRQPLFDWAALPTSKLVTRLAILYGVVFGVICWPIAGATYTQSDFLLQKIASSNVGALLLVLVLLIRLYSGWGYIGSRLQSPVIEYEGSYFVLHEKNWLLFAGIQYALLGILCSASTFSSHTFFPFLIYVCKTKKRAGTILTFSANHRQN
jgi:hypothetical protein